ncbi:MAG: hypothetical protein R3272_11345, partial [Candidatus Promineifilaceae bacterium]|nr:hypothetical protein [Candidatus Promineifilaceae bacterium]
VPADAFQLLRRLRAEGSGHFDMIVVDPPTFARTADQVANALRAYRRLAQDALAVLQRADHSSARPAILAMASCTARVEREPFFSTIHAAAGDVGLSLREIERMGHPLDHPVGFQEGAYLKCLFAEVEP